MPLFKDQAEGARKRRVSLNRLFTFLASAGVVPFDFVRDVSKEHSNQNPRRQGGREKKRNPGVPEIGRLGSRAARQTRPMTSY